MFLNERKRTNETETENNYRWANENKPKLYGIQKEN